MLKDGRFYGSLSDGTQVFSVGEDLHFGAPPLAMMRGPGPGCVRLGSMFTFFQPDPAENFLKKGRLEKFTS